jgi:hypothetical protein
MGQNFGGFAEGADCMQLNCPQEAQFGSLISRSSMFLSPAIFFRFKRSPHYSTILRAVQREIQKPVIRRSFVKLRTGFCRFRRLIQIFPPSPKWTDNIFMQNMLADTFGHVWTRLPFVAYGRATCFFPVFIGFLRSLRTRSDALDAFPVSLTTFSKTCLNRKGSKDHESGRKCLFGFQREQMRTLVRTLVWSVPHAAAGSQRGGTA